MDGIRRGCVRRQSCGQPTGGAYRRSNGDPGAARLSSQHGESIRFSLKQQRICRMYQPWILRSDPFGRTRESSGSQTTSWDINSADSRAPRGVLGAAPSWRRRLQAACRSRLRSRRRPVAPRPAHGNLASWNCRTDGDGLYVVDWERSVQEWPPVLDAVHFVVSSTRARPASRRLALAADTLRDCFNVRGEFRLRAHLALYLAAQALSRGGRMQGAAPRKVHRETTTLRRCSTRSSKTDGSADQSGLRGRRGPFAGVLPLVRAGGGR